MFNKTFRKTTCSFNSRAREGRDGLRGALLAVDRRFNSRAREGRDSRSRSNGAAYSRFNSRAREGRDFTVVFTWTR